MATRSKVLHRFLDKIRGSISDMIGSRDSEYTTSACRGTHRREECDTWLLRPYLQVLGSYGLYPIPEPDDLTKSLCYYLGGGLHNSMQAVLGEVYGKRVCETWLRRDHRGCNPIEEMMVWDNSGYPSDICSYFELTETLIHHFGDQAIITGFEPKKTG